jgi:hypothetical protein
MPSRVSSASTSARGSARDPVGPWLAGAQQPGQIGCQPALRLPAPLGRAQRGARRGTRRVIYRIDDKARVVTVVDIGHCDIYRT